MACVSPPELDDRTLLAYIDGKASADVAAHLERCLHCRERVYRLARLQGRLTALLYRIDCPSPSTLGDYYLGVLPAEQIGAIGHHLNECPHCQREIAQLEEYLAELAPNQELSLLERAVDRARVLVARLISDRPSSGLPGQLAVAPATAGLRGDESEAPLVYQADKVQVMVEAQEDTERPDRKALLGLVIGLDSPHGFEAHLWHAGQRVATAPVDELGNFCISGLLSGTYELILAGPDLEIHVQEIPIENDKAERWEDKSDG